MTTSEPTTGELIEQLHTFDNVDAATITIAKAALLFIADRLESQEQTIAALTARAEQAERERDAAKADMKLIVDAVRETPKPCPFCGTALPLIKKTTRYPRSGEHEGEAVQAFTVVCRNPDCVIYEADNDYSLSEEEAIARWNNRAGEKNITGKWIIDECDTTDETPSRAWIEFHCPDCGSNFGLEEGQYGWYAPESEIPFKVCPICGLSMDDRGGIKDE